MDDVNIGAASDPSISAIKDSADAAFDSAFASESAKPEAAPESPSAEATAPEPAKTEGSTPAPEATPPVASTQTAEEAIEWKNLVAKFGGDQNAAAKAYWDTNNRASQLAREKEELAAKLAAYEKAASPAAPEAPKPAPQELPIELKRYDEKIRSVETNFATTQQERQKYAAYLPTLDQEIRTLMRQLASPRLDIDKDDLAQKLNEKDNERTATANYIAQLDRDLKSFDEKWQELKENRSIREAFIETQKELKAEREAKARSEEERESSVYIETFQKDWNSTIEKVSKDQSIIPEVLSRKFEKYVRTLGKAHVADGTPIEDVAKFVADAAKDYMADKEAFHQVKSAEYGKQKRADEKLESPSGKSAMASETLHERANWTQEQWAKYEENIRIGI